MNKERKCEILKEVEENTSTQLSDSQKIFKSCSNLLEYHEMLLDFYSLASTFNKEDKNINIQKLVLNELEIIKKLKEVDEDEKLESKTDMFKREIHSWNGVKYLVGQRGCGHTYSAIKVSAEKQIPILVRYESQKEYVINKATKFGYVIPMPYSMETMNRDKKPDNFSIIVDDNIFISSSINELKEYGIDSKNIEFINITFDDASQAKSKFNDNIEFIKEVKELEKLTTCDLDKVFYSDGSTSDRL